jgi:D-glycero-beta-D-manno-heptose-7-phosphate kinase
MVNLFGTFRRLQQHQIMVLGDLMQDTYTMGKAARISPEAPVPVLQVTKEEHRLGGAGNVALNLLSMGAEVMMVGRVGDDLHAQRLLESLQAEGVCTKGVRVQKNYQTPVKNRIIAGNQQMVRVDHETITALHEHLEQEVIDSLPGLLSTVRLVAISDYGKGMVTGTLMKAVIAACKERSIPIIVDPKGIDFSKYQGVTIVKPNLSELYAAANLPVGHSLEIAAKRVLDTTSAEALMVTRSEDGISLFHGTGVREDFPAKQREVTDVTGAGDTVLAMLAIGVASGLSFAETSRLCNVAAGIAVSHFGCARITLSELARQLLSDDVGNKVFDEEHLFALQEALKGKDSVMLTLSLEEGIGLPVFEAIRNLANDWPGDLIVYIEDSSPNQALIDILASLHDVDYIIVQSEGIEHVRNLIKPLRVHTIQGIVLE